MLRRVVVRDRTRIVEVRTLDFLRVLEAERLIQSADQVFQLAAQAARMASRTQKLGSQDQVMRNAVAGLVRRG